MFSVDEFHEMFCSGFNVASYVTKLQSMAIDAQDSGAIACTGALYDTILDIPMLHFILSPRGKWLERAVVIGTFTVPMAGAISAEFKERRVSKNEFNEEPEGKPHQDLEGVMSLKDLAESQS